MDPILVIRTGPVGTWREKAAGIAAYAHTEHWRLEVVDARTVRTNLRKLITFWNPRGAIVDASDSNRLAAIDALEAIPTVYMNPDRDTPKGNLLSVVGEAGAIVKCAAAELLSREIASAAFIDWYEPFSWASSKREIFCHILALHGLNPVILSPGRFGRGNPVAVGRHLANCLADLPRPCGILAVNDLIGERTLSALSSLGAAVPEDFSVVSIDDDVTTCESCSPTLTSVRPDFFRMGFAAGELLKGKFECPRLTARRIEVPPQGIVRRASSRLLGKHDAAVSRALELIRLNACSGLMPRDVLPVFGAVSMRSAELRFHAATGKSIAAEIIDVRLRRACDYLRDGNVSISAIANFCGWKTDLAFRKAFRSRYAFSPRAFHRGR